MLSQPSVNSPWPEHFGFQDAVGFGLSSSGFSSPAHPSHYTVSQWPGLTYTLGFGWKWELSCWGNSIFFLETRATPHGVCPQGGVRQGWRREERPMSTAGEKRGDPHPQLKKR